MRYKKSHYIFCAGSANWFRDLLSDILRDFGYPGMILADIAKYEYN